MHVRHLDPADRAEWLRLLKGLYPGSTEADHAPVIDAFLTDIASSSLIPAAVFVIARPDGGLAGFLELSIRNYAEGCAGPTPCIESWYVDPDARRQGLGTSLIHAAEAWARHHGYTELASDTLLENHISHQAHVALGFHEVERTIHYRKPL